MLDGGRQVAHSFCISYHFVVSEKSFLLVCGFGSWCHCCVADAKELLAVLWVMVLILDLVMGAVLVVRGFLTYNRILFYGFLMISRSSEHNLIRI